MLKKTFSAIFFSFSFFCAANETSLQNIFFEASKSALTGISSSPEAEILSQISFKNIKRFYCARKAVFDSGHHLIPLYIPEILVKSRAGEIDCLYDENDLHSFYEEKSGENNASAEDENSESGAMNFSGDWISQALALYSMQTSAPEIHKYDSQSLLDYLEKGDSRGIAEQNEEKSSGEEKSGEKKEFSYFDRSGALRRFYYDGEGMSVNSYDGNTFITKTYGNAVSRKRFDSELNLLEEEKFDFASSPKNIHLSAIKTYLYEDGSKIPSKMNEIRFPEKKSDGSGEKDGEVEIKTEFNGAGLASKVKTGHWEQSAQNQKSEKEKKSQNAPVFFDDKEESYLYDDQNRIIEYELQTWTYAKNQFGKISARNLKTKYEYSYHDNEKSDKNSSEANIPPDFKFYEDGELRMEKKYSSPDDFCERMIFSDGFYVEAIYKGGVKKEEIVYNNGKESRRREF